VSAQNLEVIKTADWIIDLGPEAWPGLDPRAAAASAGSASRRRSDFVTKQLYLSRDENGYSE
jgi:hypothetical protein